jgi:hypothetical protein
METSWATRLPSSALPALSRQTALAAISARMQFFLVPQGHKLHAGSTATPHSRRTYSVESFVLDERRVALGRVTPTAGSAEHVPEHVAVPRLLEQAMAIDPRYGLVLSWTAAASLSEGVTTTSPCPRISATDCRRSGSLLTRCWREMDSNHRSPVRSAF